MQTNNLNPKKYTKIKLTIKDFTGWVSLGNYFIKGFYYTIYDDNNVICPRTFNKNTCYLKVPNFVGSLNRVFVLLEFEDLKVNVYNFWFDGKNIEHINFMDTRVDDFKFIKGSLTSFACTGVNAIKSLYLYDNNVKEIYLSQCNELKEISIYEKNLVSLYYSDLKNLEKLLLLCVNFDAIDLSSLKNLKYLILYNNLSPLILKELDISMLSNLYSVYLFDFGELIVYVTAEQKKKIFFNADHYWDNINIKIIVK